MDAIENGCRRPVGAPVLLNCIGNKGAFHDEASALDDLDSPEVLDAGAAARASIGNEYLEQVAAADGEAGEREYRGKR